jgi:kumamolisin
MHGGRPGGGRGCPLFTPKFRLRDGRSVRPRAAARSYAPPEVRQLYGVPAGLDGAGFSVGVIELGGAFSQADYDRAMSAYGLKTRTVTAVGPQSHDPGGADTEVMLDACVAGGTAPAASQRLYFGDNSDGAFVALILRALGDGCDAISVSWGAPEKSWSAPSRAAMNAALRRCADSGVNVFVASGDHGSSDGVAGRNVDFPASSPWALACGGTTLAAAGGVIASESGWADAGGGYSASEPMPDYQRGVVNGSLRGVPDVAGPADPEAGWLVCAGGRMQSVGGTSAVAPFWAALSVLLCQQAGRRVGWLAPLLYSSPKAFRDVSVPVVSNGAYNTGPGWDAITGLGSPAPGLWALFGAAKPPPPPPPQGPVTITVPRAGTYTLTAGA